MRERPGLLRWGLLLALALCVVVMHHVPAQHEQSHPPETAVVQTAAAEHHHPPAAPDHGALHLCLAIVVGFLLLLLPQLRRILRAAAELPRNLAVVLPVLVPPPLPVPRRLAALCVLRR
ncbi:hypothetical protein ABT337_05440 [Saccharopolyspora hirsuta]|uniref:Uncharacterized protein n=1 Tax=Saccharopolyspora hirsuta TaxID=1837 RepID=A0A5M7C742_SACHI|nr:hypothetical protein [Saccharopolyspora hirsuta]KAA5838136.1 hypothetical protein F1721_01385 [Saccharopolyspora hirsuta]